MKWFVVILIIYFKVCFGLHLSREDNEFNYVKSITENPWMVMIVQNGHGVVSYGTLFHPRAVLMPAIINRHDIFQMKVFADCHTPDDRNEIDHRICKSYRNITSYNIIRSFPSHLDVINFAVLTLSRSFELTSTLNIIQFVDSNRVPTGYCTLSVPTSIRNQETNETGSLFYRAFNIRRASGPFSTITRRFNDFKPKEKIRVLPGSPVVCRTQNEPDKWYAISFSTKGASNETSVSETGMTYLLFLAQYTEIFSQILERF